MGDGDITLEGRMFDDIKECTFRYNQRNISQQPIRVYLEPDYVHEGKNGVRVDIEYYLARSYRGQKAVPKLWMQLNGEDTTHISYAYPLDGSPKWGEKIRLDTEGKLSYFIPFYLWDNSTTKVLFGFDLEDESEFIKSTPNLLLEPLTYPSYLVFSGWEEENTRHHGVSGMQVSYIYKVHEIDEYAPIRIRFLDDSNQPLNMRIYAVGQTDNSNTIPIENATFEGEMKASDTLYFFIPWLEMDGEYEQNVTNHIHIVAEAIPDVALNLGEETYEKVIPESFFFNPDAEIKLVNTEQRSWEGDFGWVASFNIKVPALYREQGTLDLTVKNLGAEDNRYEFWSDCLDEDFHMTQSEGEFKVVLPIRDLQQHDIFEVEVQLKDEDGKPISKAQTWTRDLSNSAQLQKDEITIELKSWKWNKTLINNHKGDTSLWSDYSYVIEVGTQTIMDEPLPYLMKGKTVLGGFKTTFIAHREDLMRIHIRNNNNPDASRTIWVGDLGLWQQKDLKLIVEEEFPVKKLMIKVESEAQY